MCVEEWCRSLYFLSELAIYIRACAPLLGTIGKEMHAPMSAADVR